MEEEEEIAEEGITARIEKRKTVVSIKIEKNITARIVKETEAVIRTERSITATIARKTEAVIRTERNITARSVIAERREKS